MFTQRPDMYNKTNTVYVTMGASVLALIITSSSMLLHGTTIVCKDSCVAIKTLTTTIIHILILALSLSSLFVLSDIISHQWGPSLKDTDVQLSVLLLHNN